jgi:hypothetical protein
MFDVANELCMYVCMYVCMYICSLSANATYTYNDRALVYKGNRSYIRYDIIEYAHSLFLRYIS